jgi:hypothetical protein
MAEDIDPCVSQAALTGSFDSKELAVVEALDFASILAEIWEMVVNYVAVSGRPAASPAYAVVAAPTAQAAAGCSQETHLPVETT